jgi:anti-anti-sigma factor
MTGFSVRVQPKGDKSADVAVSGAMDAHTFEQFFKAMSQLIDAGTLWIVLDLREMTYITSVGINYLMNLRQLRKKAGGDMILVKPQPSVHNVLQMIGFLEVLVVAETVEDAWKLIAKAKPPMPPGAASESAPR